MQCNGRLGICCWLLVPAVNAVILSYQCGHRMATIADSQLFPCWLMADGVAIQRFVGNLKTLADLYADLILDGG